MLPPIVVLAFAVLWINGALNLAPSNVCQTRVLGPHVIVASNDVCMLLVLRLGRFLPVVPLQNVSKALALTCARA